MHTLQDSPLKIHVTISNVNKRFSAKFRTGKPKLFIKGATRGEVSTNHNNTAVNAIITSKNSAIGGHYSAPTRKPIRGAHVDNE